MIVNIDIGTKYKVFACLEWMWKLILQLSMKCLPI